MRERDLEEKFRQEVKKAGGRAYKFVSPGNSGVPDRIVALPEGKTGFVELKQKGRKPTPLQKVQIRKLLNIGCYVTVLDRPEDVRPTIKEIREWNPEDAKMQKARLERRGCL